MQGLTGVKDAAEFMKEHAMEFQMDSDKFDAVRLALNASRNNSYSAVHSERKMKNFKMKSKNAVSSAKQAVDEPVGLGNAPVEVDFIPPSRGLVASRIVRFSNMDVLSIPCLSEDRTLEDPVFEPLSEDSPVEGRIATHNGDLCNGHTRCVHGSEVHLPGDDIGFDENNIGFSPATDGDEEELDYYDAAHYANDLLTTQLLVGGVHQPSIIPLDAYFRRASISVRNFSDAIMNQGQKPHVALKPTVMVSGDYETADEEAPCRL